MKPFLAGLTSLVGAGALTLSASIADPTLWMSQARTAIGGEVAQGTVASLRIRGTKTRYVGGRDTQFSWETFWESPDKFVQVDTQHIQVGPTGSMTHTHRGGFAGDQEISETISDFAAPPIPRNKPNALVPMHKRALAQMLLPLLASVDPLNGVAPFAVVPADPSVSPRAGHNLVTFAAPDGAHWHLWLDATTHLPAALSWVDSPIVTSSAITTMTVTTTVRVPAGQAPPTMMPPPILPPPPTVTSNTGSAKVPYEMVLSDYRTDKGVTWPRRIVVTMDGVRWEELRVNRYDVNAKINARTFEVRK